MTVDLRCLAEAAGIEVTWRDVNGNNQVVSDESLSAVLSAIGLPAHSAAEIAESSECLKSNFEGFLPPLMTGRVNEPLFIRHMSGSYKITLESGKSLNGNLDDGMPILPIEEPGYHLFQAENTETTFAIAPHRAFTLDDVAHGRKLWGLSVQLYALRRTGDGGIGDFASLASFTKNAASYGADAIAVSPVHAQFSSDVTRFGPYAPSNRAAYNIFHVDQPGNIENSGRFIDWPSANIAKLQALSNSFSTFNDHDALNEFRKRGGIGLERHIIFEALQASLSEHDPEAHDWRRWPEAYRDPENPAVYRFHQEHLNEVAFHAYLQYRADEGLRLAQGAAKQSGMKIGLISDLAVGTDPAGSHSWSRQNEILRNLEIGAPPDAINREGQSWGITAFSPRGLIASGYAPFIEMLRHALRHAGGVRIDHVMGLARLWLIPSGFRSSAGAYLKLPIKDLMRLVALESYRHQAIVLGEDLGTLPEGFQTSLDEAGIAGLRVMWFERSGSHFTPPSTWTRTAVAMTSTHDLPTVAGWWQGEDIAWREKLNMLGDDTDTRAADRAELWAAFQNSGATNDPIPCDDNGAAAADAACIHLGLANSTLALLPIEDALASIDQPNLPGTVDEHPNWRRRLPFPIEDILDRPDVATRLASLHRARQK